MAAGLRAVAVVLGFGALSCAATPEPETPEELLFTVPSWCSWGYEAPRLRPATEPHHRPSRLRPAKPRGEWTRWAQARRGASDGPGLCGVRLPLTGADGNVEGEPGLCVEIAEGALRRVSLQDDQGEPVAFERGAPAPGSSWHELKLQGPDPRRLYLRVEGRAVRAYLEGSGEEVRGPCFYGEPGR
jgi:hypothetical protein